ncbi:putative sugar nucleotidyl transferase [Olivibacter sp. XZL3]|uniref:putative sugar nucleotidyl transferase n=1 Tax=Olivibacter sp. XZL3 TaxID=1735116 RepID=UPI001066F261|nr:putative sugar nucleotidyl transferase [Olivibacter sp. XZL3]
MHIILYDHPAQRINLYPLSLTRPIGDLRIGILTIAEKWAKWMNVSVSHLTADYLQQKYPLSTSEGEVLVINGGVCPDEALCAVLAGLKTGERLADKWQFIAAKMNRSDLEIALGNEFAGCKRITYERNYTFIRYPEDIFLQNGLEIRKDFEAITKGRSSATISSSVTLLGDDIFLEEGASAECCTINTLKGPVYLGKNSEIWEGALMRGPFSLGENSQVKMGTKIYSNVTVGPGCRVGGELNTCVIWGNSSKGHEGYFGSGVMGEWCNWGADSNNSNLKNNYKNVKLYHYGTGSYRNTNLQFCGLIMGDHAKCAINTAFNTGTVVGVSASIFGEAAPPTFVPDFSWGVGKNASVYELEKMFETAELVFARRNCKFDPIEASVLREVFQITVKQRNNKI